MTPDTLCCSARRLRHIRSLTQSPYTYTAQTVSDECSRRIPGEDRDDVIAALHRVGRDVVEDIQVVAIHHLERRSESARLEIVERVGVAGVGEDDVHREVAELAIIRRHPRPGIVEF